jgi:peptide/nickel transport system substrate-binding protein
MIRPALCALWAVLLLPVATDAQKARRGGTLVVAAASDVQQLNSLVNADANTGQLINHALFLPLIRLGSDLQPEPALARSWKQTDSTVVFQLRRDVRWHDGRRTTAHDAVFTLKRALDTLTAYPNAEAIAHIKSAQALDSFTLRIRMTPRREPLLGLTDLAIMPAHLLDSIPAARLRQAAFNKHPVGNGPFRFVSQRANDRWIFEANAAFPGALGGPPRLARLVWRVIPDNTAQVTEIRTGAVDLVMAARAEQLKQLDSLPDLRALIKPSGRYTMIAWNGQRAPLNNPGVRRALTLALDRARMIQLLRAGYAQLASGPVPPTHWAFDPEVTALPYDTARARRLLVLAGYLDRDRDGVLESMYGKPFELELKIAANNAFNRDVAEMVRADLARIGVRVVARPVDFATLIGDITSNERNFDGAFLNFETDLQLNLRDAFHSAALGGPYQSASYSNRKLDDLLDRAANARTVGAAGPLWSQIQTILRDDQPWAFLWYAPELFVVNERVRGIEMDIRGSLVSLQQWSVRDSKADQTNVVVTQRR